MVYQTSETPPLGAAGLGEYHCCYGVDTRENSFPNREYQARFIGSRFRLRPDRARLLAELVFDGERAWA